jgi:hypothetical protein
MRARDAAVRFVEEAVHGRDRPLEGENDLVHRDRLGGPGEPVAAARAAGALDEIRLAQEGDDVERKGVLCSHQADHGRGCATKLLWTRVQGSVVDALRRTTLAELVLFGPARERELTPLTH